MGEQTRKQNQLWFLMGQSSYAGISFLHPPVSTQNLDGIYLQKPFGDNHLHFTVDWWTDKPAHSNSKSAEQHGTSQNWVLFLFIYQFYNLKHNQGKRKVGERGKKIVLKNRTKPILVSRENLRGTSWLPVQQKEGKSNSHFFHLEGSQRLILSQISGMNLPLKSSFLSKQRYFFLNQTSPSKLQFPGRQNVKIKGLYQL